MINCSGCNSGKYSTGQGLTSQSYCVLRPVPTKLYPSSVTSNVAAWFCSAGGISTVTTCSSCVPSSNCLDISKAIDGDLNTMWDPAGTYTSYSIEFGYSGYVMAQQFYMMNVNGDSGHDRGTFTIRASNVSGSYTQTIQTFTMTPGVSPKIMNFTIPGSVYAKYWSVQTESQEWHVYVLEMYFSGLYCPPGLYVASADKCESCDPGTYSTGSGEIFSAVCQACAAGTYSSGSGTAFCERS